MPRSACAQPPCQTLGSTLDVSLDESSPIDARGIVRRDHSEARGRGIDHPEVNWPTVRESGHCLFSILCLKPGWPNFIFHTQLALGLSSLRLHAARFFVGACRGGVLLGVASNARPTTLRRTASGIEEARARLSEIFQADLTFWSFQHGFSKPDPYVFRLSRARLLNRRDHEAPETLVVGDREDSDSLAAADR